MTLLNLLFHIILCQCLMITIYTWINLVCFLIDLCFILFMPFTCLYFLCWVITLHYITYIKSGIHFLKYHPIFNVLCNSAITRTRCVFISFMSINILLHLMHIFLVCQPILPYENKVPFGESVLSSVQKLFPQPLFLELLQQ